MSNPVKISELISIWVQKLNRCKLSAKERGKNVQNFVPYPKSVFRFPLHFARFAPYLPNDKLRKLISMRVFCEILSQMYLLSLESKRNTSIPLEIVWIAAHFRAASCSCIIQCDISSWRDTGFNTCYDILHIARAFKQLLTSISCTAFLNKWKIVWQQLCVYVCLNFSFKLFIFSLFCLIVRWRCNSEAKGGTHLISGTAWCHFCFVNCHLFVYLSHVYGRGAL